MCDVLNGFSKSEADSDASQSAAQHVLNCLHYLLGAATLPPTLHKFEIIVSLMIELEIRVTPEDNI